MGCWEAEEPCFAEMEKGLPDGRCLYQSQYLKSVLLSPKSEEGVFLQAFASSVNTATMKGRILPDAPGAVNVCPNHRSFLVKFLTC